MSDTRTRKFRGATKQVANRGVVVRAESEFDLARARLEKLSRAQACPVPPSEVVNLKSTRALQEWEDLMLCQDPELWGAVDLTVAAQLICMNEFCRDLQFRVQQLGEMTEFAPNGARQPSSAYRMWMATVRATNQLRGSLGIYGDSVSDRGERKANKRAKATVGRASTPSAAPAAPQIPPPIAGTDITA